MGRLFVLFLMVLISNYWQMAVLTSAGGRQLRKVAIAQSWAQTHLKDEFADPAMNDQVIQAKLWQVWKAGEKDAPIALLCLRCWISHQIAAACYQLVNQFGDSYAFNVTELLPLVLYDSPQIDLTKLTKHKPLLVKILETYDPEKSALTTWVQKLIKSDPDINHFLLEHGLYRISPWALLNDTTLSRLPKVLQGASAGELAEKSALLAEYHRVYRQARIIQRKRSGRTSRCQEPTPEQLQKMRPTQPPEAVLKQLYELAQQLREYTIVVRQKMPPTRSLNTTIETQQNEITQEDNSFEQDEFLQHYRSHFVNSLDDAIKSVTLSYVQGYKKKKQKKSRKKARLFLRALKLFHCDGLSMGEIAKQIGLPSQLEVTRLLRLKRFRGEICTYWFNQLKQQVKTEALQYMAPEKLFMIFQQLESILSEETETVIKEAAAEAQSSKNRSTNSLFSRRLCDQMPDNL